MLHTSNEYRTGAAAAIAPTIGGVDAFVEESNARRRVDAERALDQVLADSFPASDPPSWNTGIVRPGLRAGVEPHAERVDKVADTGARAVASDVLDVSRPSNGDRTFLQTSCRSLVRPASHCWCQWRFCSLGCPWCSPFEACSR